MGVERRRPVPGSDEQRLDEGIGVERRGFGDVYWDTTFIR
jgi:hypothetical protein